MKPSLIIILILITANLYSQPEEIVVLTNNKPLGENLISGSEIMGLEYTFPNSVHNYFIDTLTGFATIQTRGISLNGIWLENQGYIIQYDLIHEKLKWIRNISFLSSSLLQYNNTIILKEGNKSYYIDHSSGNNLWKVKNDFYFVAPKFNIGVGYKLKNAYNYSNELEAINLENGKLLWTKELNRDYGWNDLFYLNDSCVLVVASGLHYLDIRNGNGWDYNTFTGTDNYSDAAFINAAGAAIGLLTGSFFYSTGANHIHDIVSNVIIDSNDIYFSSKERIAKLNKNTGKIIWSYTLPEDMLSKSSIFLLDSLIYIVNKGSASLGQRQVVFGKPFIAAYNKNSGKQKFHALIAIGDDPILGYQVFKDVIYLIYASKIAIHSRINGVLLKEKEFSLDEFGKFQSRIGPQLFIKSDEDKYVSLIASDTSKIHLITENGKILIIDKQLIIDKILDLSELYIHFESAKNFKFIANNNNTLILNSKGIKIAALNLSFNAFIIGNTIYDKQERSFLKIDLTDILNTDMSIDR